jgi:hypothetical protein
MQALSVGSKATEVSQRAVEDAERGLCSWAELLGVPKITRLGGEER